MTAFSFVEVSIASALWAVVGIPTKIGQALLSGVRVDQAISLINRVADVKGIKGQTREEMTVVMQQLGVINKARNDILHFGITHDETGGGLSLDFS